MDFYLDPVSGPPAAAPFHTKTFTQADLNLLLSANVARYAAEIQNFAPPPLGDYDCYYVQTNSNGTVAVASLAMIWRFS